MPKLGHLDGLTARPRLRHLARRQLDTQRLSLTARRRESARVARRVVRRAPRLRARAMRLVRRLGTAALRLRQLQPRTLSLGARGRETLSVTRRLVGATLRLRRRLVARALRRRQLYAKLARLAHRLARRIVEPAAQALRLTRRPALGPRQCSLELALARVTRIELARLPLDLRLARRELRAKTTQRLRTLPPRVVERA